MPQAVSQSAARDPAADNLLAARESLARRFLRGESPDFLRAHATLLDEYFRERFAASMVGPRLGLVRNPYAIIALGGYGRSEQCLQSDVDLMLLFENRVPAEAEALVREVVYPLWDAGLDVGHATRGLKDCLKLARQDYEVLTSLLDARFICGQSRIYTVLMEKLRRSIIKPRSAEIIRWLVATNRERHRRFGDSSYLLEPNLKEGQGGLRDYHTMLWIGRIKSDVRQRRDLEYYGYFSHDEYTALAGALDFVWQVRSRLHHLAGRKSDQLHFEHQIRLARMLKYRAADGQQPVERFLGSLHGHMAYIKEKHAMFLYEQGYALRRKRRSPRLETAEPGLTVAHDRLAFRRPEEIVARPELLLQIYEESARLRMPLAPEAKRLVAEFAHLVDARFLARPDQRAVFERILSLPAPTFNVLSEMLLTGLLERLIPEMAQIRDRIQYDAYHLYPVDRHSVRVVRTLKSFGTVEDSSGDPLCGELYKALRRRKPLLWAALLHDIGKGQAGGGHAARGALVARDLLGRLGYGAKDIETVAFLIEEHLLLVHTATRRDINDEETAIACARRIGDVGRLRLLYLLTVADSIATGPKAWNDWTAALLRELFLKVRSTLERGELASGEAVALAAEKRERLLAEAPSADEARTLERLYQVMSPRYLLYVPAEEIFGHVALYRRMDDAAFAWAIGRTEDTNTRTVTLCAKDRPGLFSKIAGIFTLHGMNILACQVFTWRNNVALDIFEVTPPADPLFEQERWDRAGRDLERALSGELDLSAALAERFSAYRPERTPVGGRPSRVVVDNDSSSFFTLVEVYADDFPGLLHRVTDALLRCHLDIWVARIATNVDQVVDVFYVRDFDGQKVDAPHQTAAIETAVMAVLPAPVSGGASTDISTPTKGDLPA